MSGGLTLRTAQPEDRAALARLWTRCFDESPKVLELFFDTAFAPENCLVCKQGEQIVSMLYMLPCSLAGVERRIQAHYIYAAATAPEYRGAGIMAALLNEAAQYGARRGDRFSLLLPGEDGLYDYYAKHGYTTFFTREQAELTRDDMRRIAAGAQPDMISPNAAELEKMRTRALAKQHFSVLWEAKSIDYAAQINTLYGGQLLCVAGQSAPAYALCSAPVQDCVEIAEIISDQATFPELAARIIRLAPASRYRLRLVPGMLTIPGAKNTRGGMLRVLGEASLPKTNTPRRQPYLGLTLD